MKRSTIAAGLFLGALVANGPAFADEKTLGEVSAMSADERAAFIRDYYTTAQPCSRKWYYEGGGWELIAKMMQDMAADKPTEPGKASRLDFYKGLPMAQMLEVSSMSYCAR